MSMEKIDRKNERLKNIDLAFFFFFLSSIIGITHGLIFLLICSNIGNNQIILIKNFKFINTICNVLTFLSLFVSCLLDYYKFAKKFAIFRKNGLANYILSIILCITIFFFNNFFIKILFQIKNKNDFSIAEETKYENFFYFAMINFICVFSFCLITNILQLKARKDFFCLTIDKNKKNLKKKIDKSNFSSH